MRDVTIVVGCYDEYSQAWEPFVHGLRKYWKDIPWEIIFITNEKDFPNGYRTIKVGKDVNWGDTIRKGLEQIKAPIILWMMEDYWLTGNVDTKALQDFAELIRNKDINHIRILPPAPGLDVGATITPEMECKHVYANDDRLWVFKDDGEYRASLATGLWKKDVLMSFIKENKTPWEFEHNAGIDSRGNDKYLCCIKPDIVSWPWRTNPYPNGKASPIRKCQWTDGAHDYVKYEKLDTDLQWHPNGARVSKNTRIRSMEWFYIGKNSIIDDFCYISTKFEMGKYSHIAAGCVIAGGQDQIFQLRDYCSLAAGVKIYCNSNDFANDLVILNPGFDYGAKNLIGNIDIKNYCAIGAGSLVMPRCESIPEGVSIGALSFVPAFFNLEPWSVYAGCPIKKIGERNRENVIKQVRLIEEKTNE